MDFENLPKNGFDKAKCHPFQLVSDSVEKSLTLLASHCTLSLVEAVGGALTVGSTLSLGST